VERRRADNLVEAFRMGAIDFQRLLFSLVRGFVQLISNFSQTVIK